MPTKLVKMTVVILSCIGLLQQKYQKMIKNNILIVTVRI